MNQTAIFNKYFGEKEDLETEFEKRREYLRAFGVLKDSEIENLLIYINLNAVAKEELVDRGTAKKYALHVNEKTLKALVSDMAKLMQYNEKHPDKQIVVSWIGIEDSLTDGDRILMNYVQRAAYWMKYKDAAIARTVDPKDSYTCYVYEEDGSSRRVEINLYADLSNIGKYFSLCIPSDEYKYVEKKYGSHSETNAVEQLEYFQTKLLQVARIVFVAPSWGPEEWYDENYDPLQNKVCGKVSIPMDSLWVYGESAESIKGKFVSAGFGNVQMASSSSGWLKPNETLCVTVDGQEQFYTNKGEYPEVPVVIYYTSSNRINITDILKKWKTSDYRSVSEALKKEGLSTIREVPVETTEKSADAKIISVEINGKKFASGDCYVSVDTPIVLTYYEYQK